MPIVFQQPQPFNAAISQGYGAAQMQQQNNAVVDRAMEGQNQMRFQAAQAQLARQQQMALANQENQTRQTIANYANLQHGLDQQAGIGQRQAEMEDQRNQFASQLQFQAARDSFHAQQAQAQVAQQAEAQAWVHQQDLSFKEQLDLQRMKAAVTEINNDPTLDPQTKSDLILQVKTRVDPMEARLRQSQARMMEQHAAVYQQQANYKLRANQQVADTERQLIEQGVGVLRVPDHSTGIDELFIKKRGANGDEEWIPLNKNALDRMATAKGAGPRDAFGRTPADVTKAVQDAQKRTDAYIHERQQAAKQRGEPIPQFDHDKLVDKELRKQEEELRKQFPGLGGGQPIPAPSPVNGGGQPGTPDQPFSRYEPAKQSAQQKAYVADATAKTQALQNDPTLTQEQKAPVLAAYDESLRLLEKYGGPPGTTGAIWTDEDRAKYEQLSKTKFPRPQVPSAGSARTAFGSVVQQQGR